MLFITEHENREPGEATQLPTSLITGCTVGQYSGFIRGQEPEGSDSFADTRAEWPLVLRGLEEEGQATLSFQAPL